MKNMRITSKFQTTIPKQIRNALNIKIGDSMIFEIVDKQTVILKKIDPEDVIYAKALRSTLSEWDSEKDEEAFRDLQDF